MSNVQEDRSRETTDYELPDGSTCRVVRIDSRAALISRYVGDLCVWGQAFARREDHEGQVADVVNDMRADPTAFERAWFTDRQDPTGQAMQGLTGGTARPSPGQNGQ